jgi:hypothetical protein
MNVISSPSSDAPDNTVSPTCFVGVRQSPFAVGPERTATGNTVVVPNNFDGQSITAVLQAALAHKDIASVTAALRTMPPERILSLRRELGVSALDALLREWEADEMCDDEEHWHRLLKRHSFALEQVFYTPTVIVDSKAYVGGKSVDNKGGNVADFLLRNRLTGRAMIVEIKTPATDLIVKQPRYRNNVWNVHPELSGSIIQVLTYRDSLHEQLSVLDAGEVLRRGLPGCAVIIGNTSSLSDVSQRRSFELARQRPDVTVITFDELKTRLVAIRDMLMAVAEASSS